MGLKVKIILRRFSEKEPTRQLIGVNWPFHSQQYTTSDLFLKKKTLSKRLYNSNGWVYNESCGDRRKNVLFLLFCLFHSEKALLACTLISLWVKNL